MDGETSIRKKTHKGENIAINKKTVCYGEP